jgi:hypothetical protein
MNVTQNRNEQQIHNTYKLHVINNLRIFKKDVFLFYKNANIKKGLHNYNFTCCFVGLKPHLWMYAVEGSCEDDGEKCVQFHNLYSPNIYILGYWDGYKM